MARIGMPCSLPAPTPTPTPVPTPGPCLMSVRICTASGAPRSSFRSLLDASRPMPATRRRAASTSPGTLLATGLRASGTGAPLAASRLGSGRLGSGVAVFSFSDLRCCAGSAFGATGLAAGKGSRSRSSNSLARRGGTSCATRSSFGRGINVNAMQATALAATMRPRMRRNRFSSSGEYDQARNGVRNDTDATPALMPCPPSSSPRTTRRCNRRALQWPSPCAASDTGCPCRP